jgi:hypothetical protein
MNVHDKMMRAYLRVAQEMIQEGGELTKQAELFHRTKKIAYYVEGRRLEENGGLPGDSRNRGGHKEWKEWKDDGTWTRPKRSI